MSERVEGVRAAVESVRLIIDPLVSQHGAAGRLKEKTGAIHGLRGKRSLCDLSRVTCQCRPLRSLSDGPLLYVLCLHSYLASTQNGEKRRDWIISPLDEC